MAPDPSAWAGLPPALGTLVAAEIAAGNRVVAIDPGFPAPPVGFCVLLEKDVTTPGDGLDYRQWPNWKGYHGYTDAQGHFFVLNPPRPAEPDPPLARAETPLQPPVLARPAVSRPVSLQVASVAPASLRDESLLVRFQRSLNLDYERWREGIGYDLEALAQMDQKTRHEAERLLLERGIRDWRDVEALARLDGPDGRRALVRALAEGEPAIRLAVLRHAPALASPGQKTTTLVEVLAKAAPFAGLSEAIDAVVEYHPPPVLAALWREVAQREGAVAVHYAALLAYLYGGADSVFDMGQRPFFLAFNNEDPPARAQAVAALRAKLAGAASGPLAEDAGTSGPTRR